MMGIPDPRLASWWSRDRSSEQLARNWHFCFFFQAFGILSPYSTTPSPKAIPAHLVIALGAPNEATALLAYLLRREKMEKSWQRRQAGREGRTAGCRREIPESGDWDVSMTKDFLGPQEWSISMGNSIIPGKAGFTPLWTRFLLTYNACWYHNHLFLFTSTSCCPIRRALATKVSEFSPGAEAGAR